MTANSIDAEFDPLRVKTDDPNLEEYLKKNLITDVRTIIQSYHLTYDHLQELLQNAVDICRETYQKYKDGVIQGEYQPRIDVTIDLDNNCITVLDNGLGMSKDHIEKYFFMPHATLKNQYSSSEEEIRGEKGVGATFLSFGSAWIQVASKTQDNEISSCKLEHGIDWVKESGSFDQPKAYPVDIPPELNEINHGTVITVGFNRNTNMVHLRRHGPDVEHWKNILKLFTAIGYIIPFGDRDPFFESLIVNVSVIDEGEKEHKSITPGYLYPHQVEGIVNKRLSELESEHGRLRPSSMNKDCIWDFFSTDQIEAKLVEKFGYEDKRNENGKYIFSLFEKYSPSAYVVFVWAKSFWEEINNKCFNTNRKEFTSGYAFSTKKQRMGEIRKITFSFYSGNYNRFFIIYSVKNLHGDLGRKSVNEELRDLADVLNNIFHNKDFRPYDDALRSEPSETEEQNALVLEELKNVIMNGYDDLDDTGDLNLDLIKVPHEEQDVVALFFDLIGGGYLPGYKVFATKASARYDGFAKFELQKHDNVLYDPIDNPLGIPVDKFGSGNIKKSPVQSVIEFKYTSDGLITDFANQKKNINDIRWLICWKLGKKHEREGYTLLDITDEQQKHYRDYYGVTHILTRGQSNVHVICLSKVIEILKHVSST